MANNKFKVGDRVRTLRFQTIPGSISFSYSMNEFVGEEGEITEITISGYYRVHDWSWIESAIKLVDPVIIQTNKKTIMSYLKEVSIKLRAALGDEKANQIVAGLRNDDLSLTCTGKDVILNAIADGEDAKAALIAEANAVIAKAKENK